MTTLQLPGSGKPRAHQTRRGDSQGPWHSGVARSTKEPPGIRRRARARCAARRRSRHRRRAGQFFAALDDAWRLTAT